MTLAVDARGQRLVAFRTAAELTADTPRDLPCPLALAVVTHRGAVLLGLNRWRQEWELPGGVIDAGETPRTAASRELAEETGIEVAPAELRFAGIAEFDLVSPARRELAAVYAVDLDTWRPPHPSDEFLDVRWSDPSAPPDPHAPLDLTLARLAGGV